MKIKNTYIVECPEKHCHEKRKGELTKLHETKEGNWFIETKSSFQYDHGDFFMNEDSKIVNITEAEAMTLKNNPTKY